MIYAVNKQTKEHRVLALAGCAHSGTEDLVQADPDGWIDHNGTLLCPIAKDQACEVESTRTGRFKFEKASDCTFWHSARSYRPILDAPKWNGEGLPPVGVECEFEHAEEGNWVDAKVIGYDGPSCVVALDGYGYTGSNSPRDFRPLPTEEDRTVERLAYDIQAITYDDPEQLAKHLYRHGYRKQPPQPAEDMNNPANWRAGDWIECSKSALQLTKGRRYEVLNMVGDDNPVISNDDGEREERYSAAFKHASRP